MEVKLISRKELAKHLGVGYMTIYAWDRRKLISPYCVINKSPRYVLEDVLKVVSKESSKGGASVCN